MTECEKIINKGIIPASFLEEEVRDDFLVTTERKKIWVIELDILFEIIRICGKNGIKYHIVGGNLLGSVRHKGFIPWDDDIDVCMFREDYEKFCAICSNELEKPYFFQTTLSEKNCWCNNARVCNCNTTGIRKALLRKEEANKGIFVDIFPLDALPNNRVLRFLLYQNAKIMTIIANAYSFNINRSYITRSIHWFLNCKLVDFDIKKWYIKLNKIVSSVNWSKAKQIGIVVWTPYKFEKVTWDKKDFESSVKMPYEFFEINVPSGYKNILTIQFGDYMKFPPVEERGKWHEIIFDPDSPYEEYCLKHSL